MSADDMNECEGPAAKTMSKSLKRQRSVRASPGLGPRTRATGNERPGQRGGCGELEHCEQTT